MALPVASLPSMPCLNLSGGSTQRSDLRDQVLAQLALQLLGPALGNVVTHATGGDKTAQAAQEGLVAPDERNVFQRFLGDQLTTPELEQLRTNEANRNLTNVQTINASQQPDFERQRIEQTRQQAELDRAQRDELAAQSGFQGLVESNTQRAADQPLREAQKDYYESEAGKNQILINQNNDFKHQQMVQDLLSSVPGLDPKNTSQVAAAKQALDKYLATDDTPTSAEFTQWRQSQGAGSNEASAAPSPGSEPSLVQDALSVSPLYAILRQMGFPSIEDLANGKVNLDELNRQMGQPITDPYAGLQGLGAQ